MMAKRHFLLIAICRLFLVTAAMAGLEELNYFLGKFISLWQTGRDARLHINSCDGQAHVNH